MLYFRGAGKMLCFPALLVSVYRYSAPMKRKKACIDIYKKPFDISAQLDHRINLRTDRVLRLPLKRICIYAVTSTAVLTFMFGLVNAPSGSISLAATSKEAERSALEAQLKQLEQEIADHEATVAKYQKQGKTLQGEINTLNAKIAKLNLQIKSITLNLSKLNQDIEATKSKIVSTEGSIGEQKDMLSSILQELYQSDQQSVMELIMQNPKFSDFFLNVNNLMALQDNLRQTLEKIVALKNDLVDHKESLAMEYNDVEQLKKYQELQQQQAKQIESEKKSLLTVTKGQESKYQQIVAEKKKTAAQIRSRLYELLGGGQLTFGEAYKLAKIAADATGVRPALVLAVLDRESALGRNVGKCKYDTNPYYPAQANNKTTMHPTRDIPVFLDLMKELNMNPGDVFVSCPIPRDGAYGGGMGPAQFIPSTWAGYKDKISAVTGNRPANPWNNLDAFVATALYMKSAGAVNGDIASERMAAAKYYAGGNWKNYLNTYGARVVQRAEEFQEDIDVLNG